MKKDRNCGMNPYPVYPAYQTMPTMPVPNMMGPMPGVMPNMQPYGMTTSTIGVQNTQNQSIDNLERQINMLDRRVTKLETLVNSSSTYNNFNDSNYHVM